MMVHKARPKARAYNMLLLSSQSAVMQLHPTLMNPRKKIKLYLLLKLRHSNCKYLNNLFTLIGNLMHVCNCNSILLFIERTTGSRVLVVESVVL